MANISKVSISIDKPVEKVWASLMNPEDLKHWLTGFVSAEPISGAIGQIGSISKLKFMERGKLMEVIETVIASRQNEQYTIRMETSSFENETDIRLVSFGNRTEMIQTVQFFPKGFFMKLLMPMIKGEMRKRMLREMQAFKKFVEGKS